MCIPKRVIRVYYIRTQLLHGLRASKNQKDRAEVGNKPTKRSIVRNIKFKDFNSDKKGCKAEAKKLERKKDHPTQIVEEPSRKQKWEKMGESK